ARRLAAPEARASAWPPILRFMEALGEWPLAALNRLERFALGHRVLRSWLVRCHERAFAALLPPLRSERNLRTIAIRGGGLFPRTVLVLHRLVPDATLVVWEMSREHITVARRCLEQEAPRARVRFVERRLEWPASPQALAAFDLVVLPLAYAGDRS